MARRSTTFRRFPYWRCDGIRETCDQPIWGAAHLRTLTTPRRCRECGEMMPVGTDAVEDLDNIGGESLYYQTYLYIHPEPCTDRAGLSSYGRQYGDPIRTGKSP